MSKKKMDNPTPNPPLVTETQEWLEEFRQQWKLDHIRDPEREEIEEDEE